MRLMTLCCLLVVVSMPLSAGDKRQLVQFPDRMRTTKERLSPSGPVRTTLCDPGASGCWRKGVGFRMLTPSMLT